MLKINDPAPDFTLYSTDKKEVSLKDFKGQAVLILFFPQAFTGTCTKEMCSVRDEIAYYNNITTTVLAISVDSVFTLIKYKEDQNLNFTLLSDFNKNVSAAYGCLSENFVFNMKGVSKRSAFVIDKNGLIQYAEVLENPGDLPNFSAIKATLENLA